MTLESDGSATILDAAKEAVAKNVGGCREEFESGEKCWAPAEFILWGKLLPPEAMGPRCYDHAVNHVGHHALASRSDWALINVHDLAYDVLDAIL